MEKHYATLDANEAVAKIAYLLNEVIVIYPITPASPMGEWADCWSLEGKKNLWEMVPKVVEMQAEGGAAGALHGALQAGSLATTFTASQGLLLMIPNMYKIAGELTPAVIHVAARSLAAQALSIFCDHSDVMAARGTGFALLCSNSVQEAMDFALISHLATLKSRIPFIHFFDGFRTSHEVAKIELISEEVVKKLVDPQSILDHRSRALSPDHPVLRGTAQNPDVYFQARETVNPYYLKCPDIIQSVMDQFGDSVGRHYKLYEYEGHPEAERVVVLMGSGAETAQEAVHYLQNQGEKVGLLKVRLYRPFDGKRFCETLPGTVQKIAVLDRTKEPGSPGEPLYLDCLQALWEGKEEGWFKGALPKVIGGRFGLSSKEFTPAMVKGILDHLGGESLKNHFTIGIEDDVTNSHLPYEPSFSSESDKVFKGLFYGLGSDGTVGANKNSIKIIGEETELCAQGYFVYDSRKSGAVTVSHLRFGKEAIHSTYLLKEANFLGCHQTVFLERYDMTEYLLEGGTFLLNTPHGPDEVWDHLPKKIQEDLIKKKAKFYVIDAYKVAHENNMGNLINTIMQVCFFQLADILPAEKALKAIKDAIVKTYQSKGDYIVKMNLQAVDQSLSNLHEVKLPQEVTSSSGIPEAVSSRAPEFVRDVLGEIVAGRGDLLPVSKFPADGTFPTGTTQWEKRNLAMEIPVWEPDICIQCGKCAFVCPHSVIRIKVYEDKCLEGAPETFKSCAARDRDYKELQYTIQVSPEDCTGCAICVEVCPAKSKSESRVKAINMKEQLPLREPEQKNWDFFLALPELERSLIKENSIRQQQIQQPLFEFSGACAGCGETPYLKLLTQLFGDRALVANATGCSSIYGANLPMTPWTKNKEGFGPAWSNSLFEDNGEFGLGFRISVDKSKDMAENFLRTLSSQVGEELVKEILEASQKTEVEIGEQRKRVGILKEKLKGMDSSEGALLLPLADYLVRKSVWIVGGDGWAYDIGYGGLDHVMASGMDVNILVLDTEVYSNTGGQMSKATPRAAIAKFAAGGKRGVKKDLGMMAMTYGNVYVASVAMGGKDDHTLKAFLEAESYEGPSIIIAYSHCIAHGIHMAKGMENQKLAVQSGQWLLYRFDPRRTLEGKNPLTLDSPRPKIKVKEYFDRENRFKMLSKIDPATAEILFQQAQEDVELRWKTYESMAAKQES